MISFYEIGSIREDESKLLAKYAAKAQNNIVEIGGFQGKTSIMLAQNSNQKVYVVDVWSGKKVDEGVYIDKKVFDNNVNYFGLSERIEGIRAASMQALSSWDKPIGLLFIDGSHKYQSVKNDIKWIKHVIKGGYIAFHDYSDQYRDRVVKAVDEIKDSLKYVDKINSLIIFQTS